MARPWDPFTQAFGIRPPLELEGALLPGRRQQVPQVQLPEQLQAPEPPRQTIEQMRQRIAAPVQAAPQQQTVAGMPGNDLARMLGIASSSVASLPKNATTGQALLALGTGLTAGKMGLEQQQRQERFDDARLAQAEKAMTAEDRQQAAIEEFLAPLPPEMQRVYRAFPELAVKALMPTEQKLQKQTISRGDQQVDVLMDMATGRVVEELGTAPRWQQHAPKDEPERYRMLTPDEARQYGLPPGSYQMSHRGQISRVGGDPVSRIPTADGRVIEIDETTGAVVDRTPPVAGFDLMAAPAGRAGITGETVQQGVGPGPFAATAIGTIFGGFIPEATDEQTERAKSQLSILERLTRGALTISSRPSAWEQQQIQALFADPDSFFQSPGRAGIKLQELRNELINVYNDNSRLLQSTAIQGAKRAELMQSNNDLQRAIDMVQISDADIQQLLGQQGQGGTTSSGVGWRIVN